MSVSRTTTLRRPAAAPPELETQATRARLLPRLRLSLPWGLTLLAFAVAFVQRPGRAFVDTRFDLTADPGLFLQRILHVWSGTYDLGHVQSGQSVGYLLPMGPWYALGSWLGVPVWVTQRLWLGTLYALAAWGAVRLLDALYDRRRGIAHAIAGFVFAFNPYVATFTDRASVVLLAYAALPWLLLAVHRGAAEPRRWRWPAFVGLLVAVSGGGTNATLVAMVVPAGLGLLAYEVWALRRPLRAALAFTWRAAACVLAGSLWWLIPVALAAPYGRDFLSFTEHPEAIWMTNSMSESLRLLGYWVLYVKVGFDGAVPLFDWAGPYLFAVPVILATLALPLLALGGLRWTGRWRYAPFFGLLAVGALLVMSGGYPPGAPPRGALLWAYYHLLPLQLLRTPYKAAPMLALSFAVLGGLAAEALYRTVAAGRLRLAGRRVRPVFLAVLGAVPVLCAFPFFTGRAIDRDTAYGSIPAAWPAALGDAGRAAGPNRRIMVLPGEVFGSYRWGGKFADPSLAPTLAHHPLAIHAITRYADPRSDELLAAVDDLVQQVRLVPGQLDPLLGLLGVGQVVVPTDTRRSITSALDPVGVVRALSGQGGFGAPAARYGATRTFYPETGRSGPTLRLPDLRRYALPAGAGVGIVRVHPRAGATVLDGDADGIADLAAVGGLDPRRALFYAADLDRSRLQQLIGEGASLVVTDSNRRRGLTSARFTDVNGPTIAAGEKLSDQWPRYDPFPARGSAGQTVQTLQGLAQLSSPAEPGLSSLPQYRAAAAMDGRLDTPWLATPYAPASERYLQLRLSAPRVLGTIAIHPHDDAVGRTRGLAMSVNGGPERAVRLRAGWNTVSLGGEAVRTLRLRITQVEGYLFDSPGGLDEVRLPGVRVRELLRTPTVLAADARGLDLSRSDLSVVLSRTTADDPTRAGADVGDAQVQSRFDMVDAERRLDRDVALPAARTFSLAGWASVDPAAPDDAIDSMAGLPRGWRFTSSSRFEGVPGRRASSAFDGAAATAWAGDVLPRRHPWIAWEGPRATSFDRLTLVPGPPAYPTAALVRVLAPGFSEALPVGLDGSVRLGRTVRARGLRIEILTTRPAVQRLRLLRAVAISEVVVPGLRPPHPRRTGGIATRCGALAFGTGASSADLRVIGSMERLDAGLPLRLEGCGAASQLSLGAGINRVTTRHQGIMRADHLLLRSPAPVPQAAPASPATVLRPRHTDGSDVPQDVPLHLSGPAWLVLGDSYAPGWRAKCRTAGGTRDLGAPVAIDGFANGWPADGGCRAVSFSFAPQRLADAAYAISGATLLAMLAVVLAGWALPRRWRRRASAPDPNAAVDPAVLRRAIPAADPIRRVGWRVAVPLAALAGLVGTFGVAHRFGAVAAPLTLVLLLVGVSFRRMMTLAIAGLAALPVLYLSNPVPDIPVVRLHYADEQLSAHWVAVGVVWCLGVACVLLARSQRRASDPPDAG